MANNKTLKEQSAAAISVALRAGIRAANSIAHLAAKASETMTTIERKSTSQSSPIENGPCMSYWPNGQMRYKSTMKDGKLHGVRTFYYENGQIYKQGSFENGTPVGYHQTFDSEGNLTEGTTYQNGTMIRTHRTKILKDKRDKNTKIQIFSELQDGHFYSSVFRDNQLIAEGQLKTNDLFKLGYTKDDFTHGPFVTYFGPEYPDLKGRISSKGTLRYGYLEGKYFSALLSGHGDAVITSTTEYHAGKAIRSVPDKDYDR